MIEKLTHVPIVVSDQEKALKFYMVIGMKRFNKDFTAAFRAVVYDNLQTYVEQVDNASAKQFESLFFNDQVLLLDYIFVHLLTGIDRKDGNPLNEVRIQCKSILLN